MPSADEQAARNREIIIARASGESATAIAARHGLSPARVRQIVSAGSNELIEATGPDPVHAAMARRAQYEEIYEKAKELFEQIPDSNPSPKVGALRLGLMALDRLTAWDQSVGVIPADGRLAQEVDVRGFVGTLVDAIERAGLPQEKIDEIYEQLQAALDGGSDPQLEPPS